MLLTLKFRLRDKHAAELNRQARAVNVVWNYCNETQQKAVRSGRRWLSKYALQKLTAGAGKELDLHAHTIQQVCHQYVRSREQHQRPWLRFRGRKSLGWVPFNQGHVRFDGTAFVFRGVRYEPMHRREMPQGAVIRAGSFNQDARGRWYLNCPVEFPAGWFEQAPSSVVGIDLGLKDLATLSDGGKIEMPRFYRKSEEALARAQRARKTKRVRAIHRKVANRRKDFLHKASARLAKTHDVIAVGDVSSSKLARTRLAKSVQDAGWHRFKQMLSYKAIRHGGRMLEVSEAYTTQVCSSCGELPHERPKGIADLGIRGWTCGECGVTHDRDVNAARNILRLGLETLAGGARHG